MLDEKQAPWLAVDKDVEEGKQVASFWDARGWLRVAGGGGDNVSGGGGA